MAQDFSLTKYFKDQYIKEALSRSNSTYVSPTSAIPKSTSEYITDKSKSNAEKETNAMRSSTFSSYDKEGAQPYLTELNQRTKDLVDGYELDELKSRLAQIYRDMEEEAEPEGGPIADQYADEIDAYEKAIRLKKGDSGREMTYDEMIKKHYGKRPKGVHPSGKPKFDESLNESTDLERLKHFRDNLDDMMYDAGYSGDWILKIKTILRGIIDSKLIESKLNESTEKSWNAVDVSRTAEKELSNKEWNERTAKKLEMLMKLNAAGKFKKDFDEERLQGWVDKNYSWEKLSQQFKLDEGSCGYTPDGEPRDKPAGPHLLKLKERIFNSFKK